jgi:hypothetical protein
MTYGPRIIIPLLILFLSANPSHGLPGNESNNGSSLLAQSAATINSSEAISAPGLSYIWSISGIETGQVIMVLNQNNSDLYGQAKYEPDDGQAWNGVVVGSVEKDRVLLVLTAQKGADQYTYRLTGDYDPISETISGELLQVSNGKIISRSQFQAMWINPDISSYTPAQLVFATTKNSLSGQDKEGSAADVMQDAQNASADVTSSQSSKTKYHDVRVDADRILTGVGDISQIPIGMGGSGLP